MKTDHYTPYGKIRNRLIKVLSDDVTFARKRAYQNAWRGKLAAGVASGQSALLISREAARQAVVQHRLDICFD